MGVEDIIEGNLSEFSREWIEWSTDENIRECYRLLKEWGLSEEKISTNAALLGRNPTDKPIVLMAVMYAYVQLLDWSVVEQERS